MSGVGGIDGLHSVSGRCDLCGETCDSETQELNALSCTFAPNCPEEASLYHQDCLERYLKNIRCEKNRKTGFKCPRGCGKGSKYDEPCRGKIDKSHPIHVRNDNNKKRKKAKMPEAAPEPPRFGPAAKAARAKEREEEKAKKKAAAAAAVKQAAASAPKAKATVAKKESLASAAAAARRELGLLNGGTSSAVAAKAAPVAPAVRSYEEHVAARSARQSTSQATPVVKSAWGASPAPKPSTPSPLAVSSSEAFPAVSASHKLLPTPQPNGSWATSSKRLAVASSESDDSSSRQSQGTSSIAARSSTSAEAAAAPASSAAEVPKLSKAFRKNMRRAERKREKEIESSVTSEPSPPLTPHQKPSLAAAQSPVASPTKSSSAASVQHSPGSSISAVPAAAASLPRPPDLQLDSDVVEHCLQLVAMHKMRQASLQLRCLGFAEWQSAAAVHAKGCSLHSAVAWLLEGGLASKAEAQRLLQQSAPPALDVTEEAQQLEAAAGRMGMPQAALCREVIRREGDLPAVLAALPQPLQPPQQLQLPLPPQHPGQQYQLQLPPLSQQPQGGSARQRHQRTFSPLVSAASPAQHKVSAPEVQSRRTSADSLDPLLDAVLPREIVGSTAAALHRTIAQQSRNGGSSASLGLGSIGHSNTASHTNSRVSSFDMLSVGNPWGDLLPGNSGAALDQQQQGGSKPLGLDGRNGFGHAIQQLPSPFNGSQLADLSPGPSPVGRRSFGHHHTHSSSFFGSPTLQAVASGAGLDHYASALSSQPSWASTSSNLWGAPGQMAGDLSGLRQQQQQQPQGGLGQQQQSMADVPAAALLAAAAVASDGGEEAPASGLSLGDSELNALMATLMCR